MAIPDAGTSSVDNAFVESFKSNILMLCQQQPSRLRSTVDSMTVKSEVANVERLGTTEAVEKTVRHLVTPILDSPHSRRRFGMSDWVWADLIDEQDEIRMLISPKSSYAQAAAYAMNRQYDRLIIAAASGDSTDGDGVAVPLPASQKIAAGATGMTIDKVLEAKQILDEAECPSEGRYMVVSAQQMTDMLNTTEVTSIDFNSVRALTTGSMSSFLGFQWIQTELLDKAGDTTCLAYQKSAIRLGVGQDTKTRIDPRPDVSYANQVFLNFTAGCTRLEEEKLVEIHCA